MGCPRLQTEHILCCVLYLAAGRSIHGGDKGHLRSQFRSENATEPIQLFPIKQNNNLIQTLLYHSVKYFNT